MQRRSFLATAAGAALLAADQKSSELSEITVDDIQSGLASGRFTAKHLVETYLRRIQAIDKSGPRLNAVIELNPDALSIAEALDRERKSKGSRGPLHGVPVLIKDNIDTGDRMMTTAGSLALAGPGAPKDSTVAEHLRAAGAVILGKTNLSEWANFRSTHSVSGWSGRGGQTHNPYSLDRNPSGSSSGSAAAVSANLCALAIGSETDGSIVSPSSISGLVGIKPTVGLVSRAGIVPISHTQDTAGPMTRTVRDAAILLTALAGRDPKGDPRDPATQDAIGKAEADYTKFLDPNGLRGARLGVGRKFFGRNPAVDKLIESCIAVMKSNGAEIIDPADFPTAAQISDPENDVLLYEFKADLNAYLATRGGAPVKSLAELIAFNERERDREMPWFGQELLIQAQAKGPLTDQAYIDALQKCRKLSRDQGIDAVIGKNKHDAIIAPTGGLPWITDWANGDQDTGSCSTPAAVAGYPHVTVPAGFVHGLPVGLSFFGPAWTEGKLIKLAYAFEQLTKARRAPGLAATVQFT